MVGAPPGARGRASPQSTSSSWLVGAPRRSRTSPEPSPCGPGPWGRPPALADEPSKTALLQERARAPPGARGRAVDAGAPAAVGGRAARRSRASPVAPERGGGVGERRPARVDEPPWNRDSRDRRNTPLHGERRCIPRAACVAVGPGAKVPDEMSFRNRAALLGVAAVLAAGVRAGAQPAGPGPEQIEFFETEIRPLLAERCFECHGAGVDPPFGGLRLDSRDGLLAGGDSGHRNLQNAESQITC